MDSKNGTIRPDAKRRITPTVTKTEASTTDTPRARNKAMKPDKKPKDERKNSLWNLKENKENITNNKGKRIDNTRKEWQKTQPKHGEDGSNQININDTANREQWETL